MFHPEPAPHRRSDPHRRAGPLGACLVAGCTCKDARIVSHRRAAFFAAVARRSGETADRIVAAEAGWRIPTFEGV